ncbi:MAG: photosynthetic reaction center cytochrome c subunit [Bosea sp.]|jgi:photosynthetic reaction center cytochrome c subunit|nr:photosynthetic reaction center cytochrome c subunit [Bosea sp. (in: a-proteobacteria)]
MRALTQRTVRAAGFAALTLGLGMLLAGCDQSPPDTAQVGYRGTGMEQVKTARTVAALNEVNVAPEVIPPGDRDGPRASTIYQNVKVLGDLSETEFTRIMVAMTAWVAPGGVAGSEPGQGCAYCHNLENMADESKYQYKTARRMIQMTREINTTWTSHVGATGVSCYTCHRGNPIPTQTWFTGGGHPRNLADGGGWIGANNGQNLAGKHVGRASLPADPFTPLIQYAETIRVTGKTALPIAKGETIAVTERTNALMNHMSESLAVNCTFCHNSRDFSSWKDAPPQRVTAFHGIRMLQDVNSSYLAPLSATYPAEKLGPEGDAAKAYCATCHQGAQKPINGAPMLSDYPELGAPRP